MASAKQPCILINGGTIDGVAQLARLGPFAANAQATATAADIDAEYPGMVVGVVWLDQQDDAPLAREAAKERGLAYCSRMQTIATSRH